MNINKKDEKERQSAGRMAMIIKSSDGAVRLTNDVVGVFKTNDLSSSITIYYTNCAFGGIFLNFDTTEKANEAFALVEKHLATCK